MALVEQGHLVARDELSRLVLKFGKPFLQLLDGGPILGTGRVFLTLPRELSLPLLQLSPHSKPFFENRTFLLVVLRPDRPRALERHMFVEMRQAGLPHLFVDSPDPEGHVEGNYRRLMPFDHEHGQPVRQFLFHHTIRQPERGGMQWIEIQAEAGDENEEAYRETQTANRGENWKPSVEEKTPIAHNIPP